MAKKRIVVTGMGLVSCLGNDIDLFYQQLLEGKSGVRMISHFLAPIILPDLPPELRILM